jgi:elongation factor P--(R)-beta-lysine ligase
VKRVAERARALASARTFFDSRGYVEVETPIAVPSPGLDLHLDAFELAGPTERRWLSTSPEYQMKRLLAAGHGKIFQITRAFRAGELGERHNPEFTILEFYRPNDGVEAVMRDTEQLVARVTGGSVTVQTGQDDHGPKTIDLSPPFIRMTLLDAFERFANIDPAETLRLAEHDEDTFFEKLAFVVEPGLATLDRGVFVTEYPASQASLARTKPTDPRVAERFELYVAGVELCNGFGELTDAAEQRARFERDQAERTRRGKPVYPIDERFVEALAAGMPPSAGNAIGFDRLVALACGTSRIAEVMTFTDDEL